MSAIPGRSTIAPRSAGPTPSLIRPCCLRCSKALASEKALETDSGLRCVKFGNRSVCERCAKLRKPCLPVPTGAIKRLNRLLARSDEVFAMDDGPEKVLAIQDFKGRQNTFTGKVSAIIRASRVAPTQAAMFASIAESLAQINETLNGINDVLRFQAHLVPMDRGVDDDDDDDDEPDMSNED